MIGVSKKSDLPGTCFTLIVDSTITDTTEKIEKWIQIAARN